MADKLTLFDGCRVSIVPSQDLSQQTAEELYSCLDSNGAEVLKAKRDGKLNLGELTHIIAANVDFPQYEEATDLMINIVTTAWVSASLVKGRLAPIRPYTPDPRLIFSGVNMTTADIPTSDKDAIIGAVLAMGGQETSALGKLTTHIVALSMDHEKVIQAKEKRVKCKIVLPHWFDDCLKLGKRIDERPYLLPNPEILSAKPSDAVDIPDHQHLEGATTARPNYLTHPTNMTARPSRILGVFSNKCVMLADDLLLSTSLRNIIRDLVTSGGGTVTDSVSDADILVCHYRFGEDYTLASRAGKDVGNLSWLYHLITHNAWTSPFKRLLHYPVPKEPLPGFEGTRITLSNYGGEARMYLENLVLAAGGQFTKSMKNDNTHLLTARIAGDKCDAAQEWNINMVNHLWLEESYAKCAAQSLTNPKYTHFPQRTNLGEVIGQTPFDKQCLEQVYFPRAASESAEPPEPAKKSRNVMHEKDNNIPLSRPVSADAATTLPVTKPKVAPTPKRTTPSNVSTPFGDRLVGKENQTPSSTSSRSAKDRAISRLSDLAPDLELYEKEKNRKGNGVWGGKRAAAEIEKNQIMEKERQNPKKRASSPIEGDDDDVVEAAPEAKRQKVNRPPVPAVAMKLMITSYKKWAEQPAVEERDRKKLRSLGVMVETKNAKVCTHLCAPAIVRTKKFLVALASGCTFLSTDYIDACVQAKELPSSAKYHLEDPENEKKFGIKFKKVLTNAKANKKQLLKDVMVCCTDEVPNGFETYKEIAEANGADFSVYRGRSGTVIRRPKDGGQGSSDGEPIYLISGARPSEKQLWEKFRSMAIKSKMEPRIVSTEWLLETAMSQQNIWKESFLLADN